MKTWQQAFPKEAAWLAGYKGDFEFYLSLRDQLEVRGYLSDKQTEALTRAVKRDEERANTGRFDRLFSVKPGEILEIRAWLARSISAQFNIRGHVFDLSNPDLREEQVSFRNIEVVKVTGESEKAWRLEFRYVSFICNACHLCGLELDTEISRACGVGPTCAKKLGFERAKLEDANTILNRLNEITKAIGVVGPVWVPKSQVVGRIERKAS